MNPPFRTRRLPVQVAVRLFEGAGSFCRLHPEVPGKELATAHVDDSGAARIDLQLPASGPKPYVLIPFLAEDLEVSGP